MCGAPMMYTSLCVSSVDTIIEYTFSCGFSSVLKIVSRRLRCVLSFYELFTRKISFKFQQQRYILLSPLSLVIYYFFYVKVCIGLFLQFRRRKVEIILNFHRELKNTMFIKWYYLRVYLCV